MYTPPAFRQDDPAEIAAFLRAHPLATLVTAGAGGLSATPIPMLLLPGDGQGEGESGTLIGHLAKANPQWRDLDASAPALAVFQGPGAYVTPSWYPSKAETGKVVPTWNYIAVHAHGRLELVEEAAGKLDIVTRLTDAFETGRPRPWAVSDAPEDYMAAQLRAIVGVRMRVDRLTGKWKLSQNKQPAELAGVRDGLAGEEDAAAQALAGVMGPG